MGLLACKPDPRLRPLAYVTNGRDLYEVIDNTGNASVELENCGTQTRVQVTVGHVLTQLRLVRAAPGIPDMPPDLPTPNSETSP